MSAEEIPEFKEISAEVHGTLEIGQIKRVEKVEKRRKEKRRKE